MRKLDVLRHYDRQPPSNRGAVRKVAAALDLSTSAVHRWGELVPELAARRLHDITDGALAFDARDYQEKEHRWSCGEEGCDA